jgi:hypothetical protein
VLDKRGGGIVLCKYILMAVVSDENLVSCAVVVLELPWTSAGVVLELRRSGPVVVLELPWSFAVVALE